MDVDIEDHKHAYPYSFFSFICRLKLYEQYWDECKVKWSRYRPGVAQMVGRDITLLFHDRGTRRGWAVSSMPRPHFNPGKDPVPIVQQAGWATGPVWTGGKSRPHRNSIPDLPARSQSLYRLSYSAHRDECTSLKIQVGKSQLFFRYKKSNLVFLISICHRVLNAVCFLTGNSPASEFYMPTFRNTLSVPSS